VSRKPVAASIYLQTVNGYLMEPALTTGISRLACTEDDCRLHIAEKKNSGTLWATSFEVWLQCRRSLKCNAPWTVEDRSPGQTTYRATFDEIKDGASLVDAIKQMLATPES